MPPRPSSRCCRACLQHRTNASAEAVWVTDNILSRAIQRYLNITGVKSRTVSSVPGPMYHRKRLGRRRMTELNSFQSVGALPVWALPNAPDMTKWTWEPPKHPSCWPQLPQQKIEPEPSLFPEVAPQPCGPPQHPEIPGALGRPETVQEQSAQHLLHDSGLLLGVKLQDLMNTNFRTGKAFNTRFQGFVRLLQLEISHGQLRGMQILVVYRLARLAFIGAGRALPELKGASLLPLLAAVIHGMSAAKRLNPTFVTSRHQIWTILLKHLARQEIGEKQAELFALVMETMPSKCRFRTRGAVLNVLHAYFRLWQDSTIHGRPEKWSRSEASQALGLASMWAGRVDEFIKFTKSDLALGHVDEAKSHMDAARRLVEKAQRFALKTAHLLSDDRMLIRKIAEALKSHDPRIHRSLFVIATRLLGEPRASWNRAHYNWLQVLARLPKVRHTQFKKLLQLFPKRGRAALSHVELCDLLLLHWDSQGLLENKWKTRLNWNKVRGGDDSIALAALAHAVNASHHPEECAVLFWSFWGLVRLRPGQKTVIKQVLSLSELYSLSSGFLQRLAWTSNDTRIALLLHDVLVKQTGKEHDFWWPAFWDKFSTQFSHKWKYPLINPLAIAEKLLGSNLDGKPVGQKVDTALQGKRNKQLEQDMDTPPERQLAEKEPRTSRKMTNKDARQLSRITSSLNLFINAPHLTERQKIQYVAKSTRLLARAQGFLTAKDLSSLTKIVTRVLDRGDGGSTQRLKWYLGIIYGQLGEEACAQVGMILRRRREVNWKRWRDEFRRKKEETGQQPVSTLVRKNYDGPRQGRAWPLWRDYVPKNRLRAKRLGRLEKKERLQEPGTTAFAQQPHRMPNESHQSEAEISSATDYGRTHNGDVLGTISKESQQPKPGRSVSF